MIAGRRKRNIERKASCCVVEIVEITSPSASPARMKRSVAKRSTSGFPRRGTSNQSRATRGDEQDLHERDARDRDGLAEHQLARGEGRDQELIEGSHLALPHDSQRGEEQAHQQHDHPDHGRHVVQPGDQSGVEARPRPELHASGAIGRGPPLSELLDDAPGVALRHGRGVRARAVHHDLHRGGRVRRADPQRTRARCGSRPGRRRGRERARAGPDRRCARRPGSSPRR